MLGRLEAFDGLFFLFLMFFYFCQMTWFSCRFYVVLVLCVIFCCLFNYTTWSFWPVMFWNRFSSFLVFGKLPRPSWDS